MGKSSTAKGATNSGHAQFGGETHAEGNDPRGHGFDPASQIVTREWLKRLLIAKRSCAVEWVLGAYESMRARGIKPVVTDIASIDEAARAYIEGRIIDHVDKLH